MVGGMISSMVLTLVVIPAIYAVVKGLVLGRQLVQGLALLSADINLSTAGWSGDSDRQRIDYLASSDLWWGLEKTKAYE